MSSQLSLQDKRRFFQYNEYIKKYPPSVGYFYKDIIAGHVAASFLARDKDFSGIYFDGESHYYIDGTAAKFRRILCLAYDEKTKKYYQLEEDGKLKEIRGLRHGT